MDQYEKMRKMNELAKDLKQHGFAESSFEAIEKATEVYDDDIIKEVRHGLEEGSTAKKDGEERMNEIDVERRFNKIQEHIDALTDKMNEMIQAINDMDSRITQVMRAQHEAKIAQRPAAEPAPKSAEKQNPVPKEPEPAPKEAEGSHTDKNGEYDNQRVGNYQSQDVAIDKMFYFGKK